MSASPTEIRLSAKEGDSGPGMEAVPDFHETANAKPVNQGPGVSMKVWDRPTDGQTLKPGRDQQPDQPAHHRRSAARERHRIQEARPGSPPRKPLQEARSQVPAGGPQKRFSRNALELPPSLHEAPHSRRFG
jgi:hypothetical protein